MKGYRNNRFQRTHRISYAHKFRRANSNKHVKMKSEIPKRNGSLQFENQTYINLETHRKNGQGVKTPVWFVQDGRKLFVRTIEDSWKVKQLRNNPRASIVPSTSC